jgi:hypothetical protein
MFQTLTMKGGVEKGREKKVAEASTLIEQNIKICFGSSEQ